MHLAIEGACLGDVNGTGRCEGSPPGTWSDSDDGSTVIAAAWGCCFAAAWVIHSAGAFYFDDLDFLTDICQ